MNAVKLNEGFDLVCVWSATLIGEKHASEFENWFKNEFDIEVQYLEEVTTLPSLSRSGNVVTSSRYCTSISNSFFIYFFNFN